jgi:hypothetical protein
MKAWYQKNNQTLYYNLKIGFNHSNDIILDYDDFVTMCKIFKNPGEPSKKYFFFQNITPSLLLLILL